jgi:hypothetical protein
MSVARLHDNTSVRLCETYAYSVRDCRTYSHPLRSVLPHVDACAKNQITSDGRYVHSSGRLVTRLTAYHISRHVASTFKRLTIATTHCDLSQIHQHRRGIISTMILHINPVRHPYSDCRDVNIATPISREWQEITRLLPVLLAEHLCDKDSGTIHRFLGCNASRVPFHLLDLMQDIIYKYKIA